MDAPVSRRFGLYGQRSNDFITYGGRILWHDDAAQLAYLFPVGTTQVREIPRDVPDDLMLHVGAHPSLSAVSWPLDRSQFRRQAA